MVLCQPEVTVRNPVGFSFASLLPGDKVKYTAAELKNGETTAFPYGTINQFDEIRPADCRIPVQSVWSMWPIDFVLDTGSTELV